MSTKFLDSNGLRYLWGKIKALIPTASSSNPLMNGTASPGSSAEYSRTDHVHPSDSKKVDVVAGKGLSTNDFTNAYKEKLDNLENFELPDSGVTAGSYTKVTVTPKGIVTGGSNPTTLSGYGITDAYTKAEVDGKLVGGVVYKGTVSTYADLPTSGVQGGWMYNVQEADAEHGIAAGDNVARWTFPALWKRRMLSPMRRSTQS